MFFILKNKPITLDCFTNKKHIFDMSKPLLAKNFIPEWWKNMPTSITYPNNFFKSTTAKKCAGIIDYYKTGFMVPLWSDLNIEVGAQNTEDYRWQYSDNESVLETHNFNQLNNVVSGKNTLHVKLINPWGFRCSDDISWRISEPTWNMLPSDNVCVLPGNLNFNLKPTLNINVLLKRKDIKYTQEFHFGMPLLHVTPLSERPLKLKYHYVSDREYEELFSGTKKITFIGSYFNSNKILKGSK